MQPDFQEEQIIGFELKIPMDLLGFVLEVVIENWRVC
jgi:hypothetical protein